MRLFKKILTFFGAIYLAIFLAAIGSVILINMIFYSLK